MKGRIQLIRRRLVRGSMSEERLLTELDRSEASLDRMSAVISDLLNVANLQIGRPLMLKRTRTDLMDLVRAVVLEHEHVSERHPIVVEAHVPDLVGNWDSGRLERALANLLSNAMKYSPSGGEITVSMSRHGRQASLSVADRGIGIPQADLPHVFDRFRRGKNVAGKIPGTGIGLATVRDIVERHGGTIAAKNRDGGGAIFTICLPIDHDDACE